MATSIISTLKTMGNKLITINNNKVDTAKIATMLNSTLSITPTVVSSASGWTITPSTAYLIGGDKLYVYLTAKGTFSAGNIDNTTLATISFKTQGRISAAFDTSSFSRNGILSSMGLVINTLSGSGSSQDLQVKWNLYATHAAGSSATLNFSTFIPVQPNVAYYNL